VHRKSAPIPGPGRSTGTSPKQATPPADIKIAHSQPAHRGGSTKRHRHRTGARDHLYVHFVQSDGAGHDSVAGLEPGLHHRYGEAGARRLRGDWSIDDAGTGGDSVLIITALPFRRSCRISGIDWRIDGAPWTALGAVAPGAYPLQGPFVDGVVADIILRATNIIGASTGYDVKQVITTGLPGAFGPADWSIFDDTTDGDATVVLTSLPAMGGCCQTGSRSGSIRAHGRH
jgi:hypothetical protein